MNIQQPPRAEPLPVYPSSVRGDNCPAQLVRQTSSGDSPTAGTGQGRRDSAVLLLLPQVVRIMHELSASGYPRTDLILLRGINGPPLGIPHCELAVRKPRRELSMAQSGLVFDPFSEEFLANQHEIYRRLREEAPAYYNEDLDFYALTRHADVVAAFRDYETYSSSGGIDLTMMNSDETPPKAILFMDPPEHGRMR